MQRGAYRTPCISSRVHMAYYIYLTDIAERAPQRNCWGMIVSRHNYWLAPVGASYSVAYVVTSAVLAFFTKAESRN